MRVTKAMLHGIRSQLIEGQAKLCALLASGGGDALWQEHQVRHPCYVGGRPQRDEELLRELLYDDVMRAIPTPLVD
jgi:hypothetical protein